MVISILAILLSLCSICLALYNARSLNRTAKLMSQNEKRLQLLRDRAQ